MRRGRKEELGKMVKQAAEEISKEVGWKRPKIKGKLPILNG